MARTTLQQTRKSNRKHSPAKTQNLAASFKELLEATSGQPVSTRFGFLFEKEVELIGKNHCYTFEAIRVASAAKYIAKNLPPADRETDKLTRVVIDSINEFSNGPTPKRFDCAMEAFRRLCEKVSPESWREFMFIAFDFDKIMEHQFELRAARRGELKEVQQ
jgi:hypothetical protein